MSNNSRYRNYVPALDDVLAPPPDPLPDAPRVHNEVRAEAAWLVVISANILVTAIIIAGMLIDGTATRRAILSGVLYFAPTTIVFVLALTGTLTDIVRGRQREITERIRIDAYADLAEQALQWRVLVEENRRLELQREAMPADLQRRLAAVEYDLLQRSLPAPGPQTPGSTFVTPYDNRKRGAFAEETQPSHDTTAAEAIKWVSDELYTDTGAINHKRVLLTGDARGMIVNTKVIGAKRGPGTKEALRWLLDRRVLRKIPGGYALNVDMVPRREDLRYIH